MSTRQPLKDIEFIADFAAYARGREPGETYAYMSNCNCACAQFIKGTGRAQRPSVGGWEWTDDDGQEHSFPSGLTEAIQETGSGRPNHIRHTWGELASRLEALLVDAPVVERQ